MFQRVAGNTRRHVDEENPYWISFFDIMAGLLIIFILASVVSIIQLNKRRELLKQTQNQLKQTQNQLKQRQEDVDRAIEKLTNANDDRANLLDKIKKELKTHSILVEVSKNKDILRIPDKYLFFKSRSYQIPLNKQKQVAAIGETLYNALLQGVKDKRHQFLDTIFIEGHTDSRPARTLELGNWGLSADRAIQVWRFWTGEQAVSADLANLRNFDDKLLFSVSGYAATRRLEQNDDTPKKRLRNRRIDLRFTVRQPVIEDYLGVFKVSKKAQNRPKSLLDF